MAAIWLRMFSNLQVELWWFLLAYVQSNNKT